MERWNGICLAEEPLREMLTVGQFGETFDWLHFVAVAAGFLSNVSLLTCRKLQAVNAIIIWAINPTKYCHLFRI